MGPTVREFPRVVLVLNQLLKAATLKPLPENTKPQNLARALTELLMEDMRKQLEATAPGMAQMAGHMTRSPRGNKEHSDQYQLFKRAGFPAERAMRMARMY